MSAGFAEVLSALDGVEGWLSEDQAQRLWERARELGPGARIVEIGSFRGRSTIALALGAPAGAEVIAIDPHAGGDRGPREIAEDRERGEADARTFASNLAAAGVSDRVRHVRLRSSEALDAVPGEIDLLYVDGAHRLGPARADIATWGERVRPGGVLLIHDAFSSIGVTLAILLELALGARFAYRGRARSLTEYARVDVPLGGRGRLRNSLAQLAQLPWFARNVAIKLALVARLEGIARALGHRPGDEWPY